MLHGWEMVSSASRATTIAENIEAVTVRDFVDAMQKIKPASLVGVDINGVDDIYRLPMEE